jgi:site-specific DNA-cytosine methylase
MANAITSERELLEYLNALEACKDKLIAIENVSHLTTTAKVNSAW